MLIAEDSNALSGLVNSLKTGFEGLASSMIFAIGSIAPVMLPVLGGIAVIGIGIVVFKKLGK